MKARVQAMMFVLVVAAGSAFATDIGHDVARRLRRDGVIVPLGDVVADVTVRWPGRVLETELEREDGRYIYEIELLGDDGHVYEFEYDAQTGRRLAFERER